MDQNDHPAGEAAGRPQRERTPTAKMLAFTSSTDSSAFINDIQGDISNAAVAVVAEEGTLMVKRGRGRPRKDGSITPTNRPNTKVSTLKLQARFEDAQIKASTLSERSPTETKPGKYFEECRERHDQLPPTSAPFLPLLKSDLPEPDPLEAEETKKKQSRELSLFEWAPAESGFEEETYFEEDRAFYHQLPYNSDSTVPLPNPFGPEILDPQTSAIEQLQVVSSETSCDFSVEEEVPSRSTAFPFSVDMPTQQPLFYFRAARSSQSDPSSSSFETARFHAVKRAPTAQNQYLWQGQASPQISRIALTTLSDTECLDRQRNHLHNGEMNATGGEILATIYPQQQEDIRTEDEGLGTDNEESNALPGIPNARVDGVSLADIDEFIWHFVGYAGISNPPRDLGESLDGMIKVLTKWNSIYTIFAAPLAEDSHFIGDQVGLHLAIRLACKGHVGLLKPLAEYFHGLAMLAETEIQTLSNQDMGDYEENGEISWMYMQLMQSRFAKQARVKVIEIAKMEASKQQEARKVRRRVALNSGVVSTQVSCGSQTVQPASGTSAAENEAKGDEHVQAASDTSATVGK